MVASEHTEVIEGRQRLILMNFLDYKEAYEYASIDNNGADLDEEGDSGLLEAGVRTGVTEAGT